MAVVPFIGSSYRTRSLNYDCQRAINFYLEKGESGQSKSQAYLVGTPGLSVFSTLPEGPTRGSLEINGRSFMVSGSGFYEITSNGSYLLKGGLDTVTGSVSLSSNGVEVCLVDGPNGYIYRLLTDVYFKITDDAFLGADTVTFCDGYFIFNRPNTGVYYISNLYSGGDIDGLEFASAEGSPDNLVAVRAVHNQVWLLGTSSIEVVYNSGAADFPFTRIQGTFIEYGCAAAFSVANTANTVFWLGQDAQGDGIVWMAEGYQPKRISTFAVEYAIQQYANIADAVGYTYQEDGHYFYVLNFTSANTTWVYDIGQDEWHERAFWNKTQGRYERHRGNNHMFVFGRHLVGDYNTGVVYDQSLSYFDDAGDVIRRARVSPHTFDDLEYIYFDYFQLDVETGVGLNTGNIQDTDPQIMLRWSNDSGHTWSNELWRSAGKIGEFKKRCLWRRLGKARDRVWEVATTARCPIYLINGHAGVNKGNNV